MPAETGDEALVRQVRGGRLAAFAEIMSRYEGLVYRVSFSYTRHEEDALDVTQNVFLKAFRGLASFRGGGSLKAWLMRITHHENLNWLRDQAKHRGDLEFNDAHAPAAVVSPESELQEAETRELLLRAIPRLNPKQQQAIRLRYFGGLPIRDIAAALDSSEGVAKNILFRGLQKLRGKLAVHGTSGSREMRP